MLHAWCAGIMDESDGSYLVAYGMWGAVCAQKKPWIATHCSRQDSLSVLLPLKDGQAEIVRP